MPVSRVVRGSVVAWGLALGLSGSSAGAQQAPEAPAVAGEVRRPLLVQPGRILALYGLGVASSVLGGGTTSGPGVHAAFQFGVMRGLDVELAGGLRLGEDGGTLAADRYARVGREEVYQVGNRTLGNPTVRLRYGLVDGARSGFQLGVELRGVMPLAAQTVFSFGVGVPVAVGWRALRVESGMFVQWVPSDSATIRNVLNVPWRVWMRVGERVSVGLVGEFTAGNVVSDDATGIRVGLGFAAALRLTEGLRLLGQLYVPTVHPFGTDAAGVGLSFVSTVR